MHVGSLHPFPVSWGESKGWFGSAAAKPLLHHSGGAAAYGGKMTKRSRRSWEDKPLARAGVVSAIYCWDPQPDREVWRGGTLPYTFFFLHVIFNDYWCAMHALDYGLIDQSGSTFKVTGRKRGNWKLRGARRSTA